MLCPSRQERVLRLGASPWAGASPFRARAREPRPGLKVVAREGAVVRARRRVVAVGISPSAAAPAAASACQVP